MKHTKKPARLSSKAHDAAAFSWGLLEATFFFIVPDVLISYRALSSFKAALRACVFSIAGAVIGGTLMYVWAAHSSQALQAVQAVPAVSSAMVSTTRGDLQQHGTTAILEAPLRLTPYKLYAVLAPASSIGLLSFIVFSILARLWRFVLVASITSCLSRLLGRLLNYRQRLAILCLAWISFYALYFVHNGL